MRNLQALLIDLDGTVYEDGKIYPGTLKTIEQLKKLESVLSNIDLESIKKVALEMLQNFNK